MDAPTRDWRTLPTDSLRRYFEWIDGYTDDSVMTHGELVAAIQKYIDAEAAPDGCSSTESRLWFQVDHKGWGDP